MQAGTDPQAPRARFLDSFLEERNIKWILGLGILLLVGSSAMLVVTYWESCAPFWQQLIFIGAVCLVWLVGEVWCPAQGLRRTSDVLGALTLVLMPLTFMTLGVLDNDPAGLYLLFPLQTLIACGAGRRTITRFLQRPQPTFLASYLILCLGGAVAPHLALVADGGAATLAMLFFWGVLTAGSVKVTRHTFWLAEEHRWPRLFGFFPIALLGGQFLLLTASLAPRVALDWLGFHATLTAVPVLLTADPVLRVFQARTGDLLRPLPWATVLPLLVGVVLVALGVCLAASGLTGPGTGYAMAPSALVAAVLMALVARRTRKVFFVWAALLAAMLAYNFSPVFFRDLAGAVVERGAQAVREPRLPYPFYGLTYVPLLLALTVAARLFRNAGHELFAGPVRRFSVLLGALLLVASFGHEKAILPVNLSLMGIFIAQAFAFDDRRPVLLALLAWTGASAGIAPFSAGVLETTLPFHPLVVGAAAALLVIGLAVDDRFGRLPLRFSTRGVAEPVLRRLRTPCQSTSLLTACGLALSWLLLLPEGPLGGVPSPPPGPFDAASIACLLAFHAILAASSSLGWTTLIFAGAATLVTLVSNQAGWATILDVATGVFLCAWIVSYALAKSPQRRWSRAFAGPLRGFGLGGLSFLLLVVLADVGSNLATSVFAGRDVAGGLQTSHLLVVLWSFDGARRARLGHLALLGGGGLLALLGTAFQSLSGGDAATWLPAVWAGAAALGAPLARRLAGSRQLAGSASSPSSAAGRAAVARPLEALLLGVLVAVSMLSLGVFSNSFRVAALIAFAGWIAARGFRSGLFLALLNWHLLLVLVHALCPETATILDIGRETLPAALPLAFASASSLLAWKLFERRPSWFGISASLLQRSFLRCLFVVAAVGSLWLGELSAAGAVVASVSFAAMAFSEFLAACRSRSESRVWTAQLFILAAVGYLFHFGWITFGHGVSTFIVLLVGIVFQALAAWAGSRGGLEVLRRPFAQTAMVLPGLSVLIGIARHLLGRPAAWPGLTSLALLGAATFYFWRGVEGRRKGLVALSGIIVNVALILLWRDLDLTEPQFYAIPLGLTMIGVAQLFKREIPPRRIDAVRYLGALLMLASPTVEIVQGSWTHMLSLMVVGVLVVLLAIGLKLRALMYCGTAFLVADVLALILHGSKDHPGLLWIAGLALGAAVLTLGAACENHREAVLQRVRRLSTALERWE